LSQILREHQNPQTPVLSVIIPAKNEELLIRQTLVAIDQVLTSHQISAEIIVIDDGSQDKTSGVVSETAPQLHTAVRTVRKERSCGKGGALIEGFAASRADYVAFIDADLEYPPEMLPHMLWAIQNAHQPACAIAVRKGDTRSWWERVTSRAAHALASVCLHVPVTDTQAGLKMFPGWFARQVLPTAKETGWLFDLEALSQATSHHMGILQFPVQQTACRPRRAKIGTMMSCLPSLARLTYAHWRYRQKGPMMRFTAVGLANTTVDFGLYTALVTLIPPHHRWWAAGLESFISWGMATLFSRTLHSRITFRSSLPLAGFYGVTLAGLFVQLTTTALLANILGNVGALGGKFLGILFSALITFLGYQRLASSGSRTPIEPVVTPTSATPWPGPRHHYPGDTVKHPG